MLLAEIDTSFLGRLGNAVGLYGFEVGALLSVILVTLICGMVGALVVGNRMAFFSDAMAHCAFAGIALGILLTFLVGNPHDREQFHWLLPLIMVSFGAIMGIGIAFVRERTSLASDTVIGVFFAGAIGFGAMLLTALQKYRAVQVDQFLFGSPMFVQGIDLLYLLVLLLLTGVLLMRRYNHLVLGSFNPSLARTRRVALRLNNYLFILLLALIVNFSIAAVGALLINAMLVVPAATASNLARNLRQMFWLTVVLSLAAGLIGLFIANTFRPSIGNGHVLEFGIAGTIICVSVLGFFLSMMRRPWRRPTLN
jgi:zinc transport system permease protein